MSKTAELTLDTARAYVFEDDLGHRGALTHVSGSWRADYDHELTGFYPVEMFGEPTVHDRTRGLGYIYTMGFEPTGRYMIVSIDPVEVDHG